MSMKKKKIYCKNCKKEVSIQDKTCPHCGNILPIKQSMLNKKDLTNLKEI
ncbi:MAG: zinc ribbon domain-containing protein [Candidatus Thorarchaeota archaeon]